ncbi:IclR family transcriptional regulator [Microbacterium resistens]|uniref:IclR family transcriptional regulator n=1 Tax=Microbacterium resistens TaxID=156977 RepID=UPI001C589B8D|nr:IclR family transcriptional regulator [Microbacterium resistens]MBW1639738.1 IclR family transcriptional regulator [Microbacterium resistens]
MNSPLDEKPLVGADRVLAVLVELGNHPAGVSLDDLTHRLSSSKPTIHRALTALRRAGLATQVSRGIYALGDEFVRLALRFQAGRPEGEVVEPALHDLVRRYNETAHFAVLEGAEVVYRAKVDPPEGGVRLTSVVGGRNPAYRTAVGKLLLSYTLEDPAALRDLIGDGPLEARTPTTITAVDELWAELQRTREREYAIDDQENELGINCVAVPVRWARSGRVIGAISVSALVFRTPLDTLVADIEAIQKIVDMATMEGSA